MCRKSSNNQDGFTLFELIVVIGIITIMSAISFAGLNEGSRYFVLQDAARVTADLYRQAQAFATNIRENPNDSEFTGKFGIFVNINNSKEIIFYADSTNGIHANQYDDTSGCKNECVESLSIDLGQDIEIVNLIVKDTDDNTGSASTVDILFKRPFVDAHILITGDGVAGIDSDKISEVEIILGNSEGQKESVIIGATGYIYAR